ncbi:SPOR domain-containing protein [Magnetofaba australis]|uniref:Putative serine/threonine protein kinase n=1 Tax=Magnetofaba australis IT-1 TaxID=1434232 RepID=A0A1Y2JZE0_9PROT|nr:SPOR domain-containing protein [Magnetofaba australis]OSM00280.1 putative serine/threonine protein kinase [Magnetofaba australis IT-1]
MVMELGAKVVEDRYIIEKLLGEGPLGATYLARDSVADALAVIKTIPEDLTADTDIFTEFKRHYHLTRALEHPVLHVGASHLFDGAANLHLLVIPYAPGINLRQSLKQEPGGVLPLAETLRIARHLAEGLDHAHAQGVVHRSIKPENVILGEDGEARLLDTLLAYAMRYQMRLHGECLSDACLAGATPYTPPEELLLRSENDQQGWERELDVFFNQFGMRALGAPPEAAGDIYALAVLLHEMLTGEPPMSVADLFYQWPNPPAELTPEGGPLSAAQRAVFNRALAWDPAARFATAGEFVQALAKAPAYADTAPAEPATEPLRTAPVETAAERVEPALGMSPDAEASASDDATPSAEADSAEESAASAPESAEKSAPEEKRSAPAAFATDSFPVSRDAPLLTPNEADPGRKRMRTWAIAAGAVLGLGVLWLLFGGETRPPRQIAETLTPASAPSSAPAAHSGGTFDQMENEAALEHLREQLRATEEREFQAQQALSAAERKSEQLQEALNDVRAAQPKREPSTEEIIANVEAQARIEELEAELAQMRRGQTRVETLQTQLRQAQQQVADLTVRLHDGKGAPAATPKPLVPDEEPIAAAPVVADIEPAQPPIPPKTTAPRAAGERALAPAARATAPSPNRYVIQVAAHPDVEGARRELARLSAQRFDGYRLPLYIGVGQVNGAEVYRVRFGPFANRPTADRFSAIIRAAGLANWVMNFQPDEPTPSGASALQAARRSLPAAVQTVAAPQPVAAPATPTAQAQAAPTAGQERGWAVQVGAFTNPASAREALQGVRQLRWKAAPMPGFHQQATVNGVLFHRVRIGPFASREEADELASYLLTQSDYDALVTTQRGAPEPLPATAGAGYAVQLGAFTSPGNAELVQARLAQRAEAAGLAFFQRIEGAGDQRLTRLLIGPFAARAAAERARQDLADLPDAANSVVVAVAP